ncbi:photosystem II S4 domain protein [Gloeocapsa sp. PCC 73106]|uniref:photosystem II S4 domain protein n=1 Tax=Gloeocapsa sp. PCC 73106 TaxID=102232 RepID=UPI0002ACD72E|nr:photosystem II S4 domain protein [Gloeocapsa sp. PCC 73106]ELR98963.1 photosystem II S4 domain protein [Gloeocapsa sp. PCC 73106]
MLPRAEILKRVENREEIARILDLSEQAWKTWSIVLTDFLSPTILVEALPLFTDLTELHCLAWGGYPQAERQRLGLGRTEVPIDTEVVELAVLKIEGNFLFDVATHRDFLGAILGTGIVRDKIGDIIVLGERGAQVIVVPEMVDFLCGTVVQVRSVSVQTKPIAVGELKITPAKTKEIQTVEASMRLDAIASAGFGLSRSKMAEAISSGDVRVNWKEVSSPSYQLHSGDLISFQGKGRLQVGEVAITKKERYRVQLTRYL